MLAAVAVSGAGVALPFVSFWQPLMPKAVPKANAQAITALTPAGMDFCDRNVWDWAFMGVIYTKSMALYFGLGSLIALGLGPALAYFAIVPPIVGFGIFAASLVLGLLAAVWGLIAQLRLPRRRNFWGVFLALPAIVVVGFLLVLHRSSPMVNDITTDLRDPPQLEHAGETSLQGKSLTFPKEFKDTIREHYGSLAPQYIQAPAPRVFDAAVSVVKRRSNWKITNESSSDFVIEGEAKSDLFGFIDDFVIRIRPTGEGALIDMRSRSRVGEGDFGANYERIQAFFGALRVAIRRE